MIKQKLHFEVGMVRMTIMKSETIVEHFDQTVYNGACGNNDPFMSGSQVDPKMIPITDVKAFLYFDPKRFVLVVVLNQLYPTFDRVNWVLNQTMKMLIVCCSKLCCRVRT